MNTKRNKKDNMYRILIVFLILSMIVLGISSLMIGRYSKIDFQDIILAIQSFFTNNSEMTLDERVILNLRMPRILASLMIGCALALSGASYQALFSNPVASPDTLGVSYAASFGAVLGIILGLNDILIKAIAFFVGIIAIVVVYRIANKVNKKRNVTIYLLLVGMVISSVFSALLSIMKYVADPDDKLPHITYWLMGSMSRIQMRDVLVYFLAFLIGAIPLFLLRWRINLLCLGSSELLAIGENVHGLKRTVIFCATLLTSMATAMTGGISWIGLIIPHIARMIVGNDYRKIIPLSGLLGADFLLLMDDLSRAMTINELPISILTSLLGAPIFLLIMIKSKEVKIIDS